MGPHDPVGQGAGTKLELAQFRSGDWCNALSLVSAGAGGVPWPAISRGQNSQNRLIDAIGRLKPLRLDRVGVHVCPLGVSCPRVLDPLGPTSAFP